MAVDPVNVATCGASTHHKFENSLQPDFEKPFLATLAHSISQVTTLSIHKSITRNISIDEMKLC